ncbi:ABC transporter permease [Ruminococcus flavefaciens]|uniref:ABC-2 family transporter protein n=1 Tax=Ruminococcus flavefaciens TaxID=1265 RepID=A0A1K1Q0Y0_RUMFL|nr:ABC transporter permease [Ruminococcus flavefaciens]SFW53536.1 ABC-2 family transporter protein [Ruminococcus flavefaciens]
MRELLAEGYRRLFKGKRFYIVLSVIVGFAVLVLSFVKVFDSDHTARADGMLFMMTGTLPLLISIAAGLLIVQDYRNNTVRNKIIIGHSRTNIYLANLIVSVTVAVIYQLAFWLTVLALGYILLQFEFFPCAEVFANMGIAILIQLTFTSIIVFFCNTMKNVGGFVISLIMHEVVLMMSPIMLLIRSEKVQDFIGNCLPSFQVSLVEYNYMKFPDGLPVILIADALIIVVTTIGGILLFNKSDLK